MKIMTNRNCKYHLCLSDYRVFFNNNRSVGTETMSRQTYKCSRCGQFRHRWDYSLNQMKKGYSRRCISCIKQTQRNNNSPSPHQLTYSHSSHYSNKGNSSQRIHHHRTNNNTISPSHKARQSTFNNMNTRNPPSHPRQSRQSSTSYSSAAGSELQTPISVPLATQQTQQPQRAINYRNKPTQPRKRMSYLSRNQIIHSS